MQRCRGAWEHADTAEVQVNLVSIISLGSEVSDSREPIKLNIQKHQVEVHNVHQILHVHLVITRLLSLELDYSGVDGLGHIVDVGRGHSGHRDTGGLQQVQGPGGGVCTVHCAI